MQPLFFVLRRWQVMNSSVEERPQWMRILAFLYKHLGEDDVCSALRRRFAVCPETKVAISFPSFSRRRMLFQFWSLLK